MHQKSAQDALGRMKASSVGVYPISHLMVIKVLAALARIVLSNPYAAIASGNARCSPLSS